MKEAPRPMQALYGLRTIGYGAAEDTNINTATGQDHAPAALMYPETGTIMAAAVMPGIKDIGQDNFNVQI